MQEYKDNQAYLEELAGFYYENSQLDKALKLFEKANSKNNNLKTRSILSLANIYNDKRSLGLYQAALEKLTAKNKDIFSQENNRTISKVLLQQMLLKQRLGIQQDALSIMKEIRASDPYYLEVLYYLFLFYLNEEDENNSLETIKEFIYQLKYLQEKNNEEITFYDKDFYLQIVDILLEGNYFAEALQILYVVQDVLINDIQVLYLMAFCLHQLNQTENLNEILKEIDLMIEESPQEYPEIISAVQELKNKKKQS